jgi:hypothetical protein
MHISQRIFGFGICVATLACLGHLGAQPSGSCLGENSYIKAQRTEVTGIVAGSDTTSVRLRAAYDLPAASATEVSLIGDEAVCAQAAQALRSSIGLQGDPVRPVWVLKLGPQRYFVADGVYSSSGRYVAVLFDANFVQKRTLLTG